MAPKQDVRKRLTRRDAKAAAGEPKKPKLTPEEQEDLEEKELEEACEKWCGKAIQLFTLGSMVWGIATSVSEWAFRPPVLVDRVDLHGLPPFVLTGATRGLGIEAARRLAYGGAHVVLGARNLSAGAEVAAALRAETGNDAVHARHLDLASLSSVVAFAASFADEEDGISALLHNAASVEKVAEADRPSAPPLAPPHRSAALRPGHQPCAPPRALAGMRSHSHPARHAPSLHHPWSLMTWQACAPLLSPSLVPDDVAGL
jgi:hypothetical protein